MLAKKESFIFLLNIKLHTFFTSFNGTIQEDIHLLREGIPHHKEGIPHHKEGTPQHKEDTTKLRVVTLKVDICSTVDRPPTPSREVGAKGVIPPSLCRGTEEAVAGAAMMAS